MSSGASLCMVSRRAAKHPVLAVFCVSLIRDVTKCRHDSQARTFEQGPPRLGRKSVFQSLQELADSEDTIQQQGQRARSPEERNREHDRAASHRWAGQTSFDPSSCQEPASLRLSTRCLSAAFASWHRVCRVQRHAMPPPLAFTHATLDRVGRQLRHSLLVPVRIGLSPFRHLHTRRAVCRVADTPKVTIMLGSWRRRPCRRGSGCTRTSRARS